MAKFLKPADLTHLIFLQGEGFFRTELLSFSTNLFKSYIKLQTF